MKLGPAVMIPCALLVSLLALEGSSEAQGQRYKLGGGAGFASVKDPEFDIGGTAIVGGFFGFRFNDNVSLEAGTHLVLAEREYNVNGVPLDKVSGLPTEERLPALRLEANRYHVDGTLLFHIGRRQPFHPFVFAGGGVVRRDEKQTELDFSIDEETGQIIRGPETVISNVTEYDVTGHVGAGFDFYFMYNLSARAEFRLWLPQEWDRRTRMFFFAATYYF